MPKTFSTEDTESGCLSRSALAILSPHCECFIKIRTVFYYNFAPGWSQSIFCRLVTILRHPP
ncbi:hypothetical protein E6A27_04835 [Escherichia coli]|nr:hypothetical protein [Escherichia coli]